MIDPSRVDPAVAAEGIVPSAGLRRPSATALALKAEILLGFQLATRQRAPRLAGLLALAIGVLTAASPPNSDRRAAAVMVIGSTVATVAASRLLAPGPALAAARMVAGPWWMAPAGRLAGMLCAVLPVVLAAAAGLGVTDDHLQVVWVATVTAVYAASLGACTMALAPSSGASGAATVGFLAAWVGGAPPSAMAMLFAGWPPLQNAVLWLWIVLPLPWRAAHWLASSNAGDPLLLLAWAVFGVGLAGWQLAGPRRGEWRDA